MNGDPGAIVMPSRGIHSSGQDLPVDDLEREFQAEKEGSALDGAQLLLDLTVPGGSGGCILRIKPGYGLDKRR